MNATNKDLEPSEYHALSVARYLLIVREKGPSVLDFFRWDSRNRLIQLMIFPLVIGVFVEMEILQPAILLAGICVGALAKDFSMARRQIKSWPVHEKLLDWDKVERMAAGESVV